MVKPVFRTKSIRTKVTDEEYSQLEAQAGGRAISEWAREVLLKPAVPSPVELALMGEVIALRTILWSGHNTPVAIIGPRPRTGPTAR